MVNKWIQKVIHKPGRLHFDLGIPKEEKIPMKLLDAIVKAEAGDVIKNPVKIGKRKILVTRKIEQRAILARNLKRLKK